MAPQDISLDKSFEDISCSDKVSCQNSNGGLKQVKVYFKPTDHESVGVWEFDHFD